MALSWRSWLANEGSKHLFLVGGCPRGGPAGKAWEVGVGVLVGGRGRPEWRLARGGDTHTEDPGGWGGLHGAGGPRRARGSTPLGVSVRGG